MNAYRLALKLHADQRYGKAPYEVHLRAAVEVLRRFGFTDPVLIDATWLHDTIEDTGAKAELLEAYGISHEVVRIVEAVTDAPGATRAERKKATYPRIAASRAAVAVKLADRIANVEAGGTEAMYRSEHSGFRAALYNPEHGLDVMWHHLDRLLGCAQVQEVQPELAQGERI